MSQMPSDMSAAQMWTLSADRKSVRLLVPALRLRGLPEPLSIHLDCDAALVDEILQRLSVLRAGMLPAPTRN